MFEKEAEEYRNNNTNYYECDSFCADDGEAIETAYQKGAEFGYNMAKIELEESYRESLCNSELNLASVTEQLDELEKANEWHYVKDGDYPKDRTEKKYLVALKSEYGGFFYELDIWCESLHCFASNNPTKVYAWKEIVLPELKESE